MCLRKPSVRFSMSASGRRLRTDYASSRAHAPETGSVNYPALRPSRIEATPDFLRPCGIGSAPLHHAVLHRLAAGQRVLIRTGYSIPYRSSRSGLRSHLDTSRSAARCSGCGCRRARRRPRRSHQLSPTDGHTQIVLIRLALVGAGRSAFDVSGVDISVRRERRQVCWVRT